MSQPVVFLFGLASLAVALTDKHDEYVLGTLTEEIVLTPIGFQLRHCRSGFKAKAQAEFYAEGEEYFGRWITPTPILLRSRSGYFERALSACSFVLNGFDKGVKSPATYEKSSQRTIVPPMSDL